MPNVPPMLIPEKSIFHSRVLWLNAISMAILVAGVLIDMAVPLAIPTQAAAWLTAIVAILNGALRFIPPASTTTGDTE